MVMVAMIISADGRLTMIDDDDDFRRRVDDDNCDKFYNSCVSDMNVTENPPL